MVPYEATRKLVATPGYLDMLSHELGDCGIEGFGGEYRRGFYFCEFRECRADVSQFRSSSCRIRFDSEVVVAMGKSENGERVYEVKRYGELPKERTTRPVRGRSVKSRRWPWDANGMRFWACWGRKWRASDSFLGQARTPAKEWRPN
jgi:hypothetical protein